MDDQPAATGLVETILADVGGTSAEKVRGLFAAAAAIEPTDQETATYLSLFQMAGAMGAFNALPDDPDELDGLLLRGAELLLQLRSDHWSPLFIGAAADVDQTRAHAAAIQVVPTCDCGARYDQPARDGCSLAHAEP